jgi:hypothetical protein
VTESSKTTQSLKPSGMDAQSNGGRLYLLMQDWCFVLLLLP